MLASFLTLFLSLFISTLPFLLLGSLSAAALAVYVPTEAILKLASRRTVWAIAAGSLLGLFLPVGDVGVLPLVRRLVQKGAPVPFGIAFLLSAPSINLVALASTAVAFGIGPLFWGRSGLTLLVAAAAGWLFSLEGDPAAVFRLPEPEPGLSAEPAEYTAQTGSATAESAPGALETAPGAAMPGRAAWRVNLDRLAFATADEFFYFGTFLVPGILIAAGVRTFFPWLAVVGTSTAPLQAVGNLAGLAFVYSSNSMEIAFTSLGFAGSQSFGPLLVFLTLGSLVDLKRLPALLAVLRPKPALYVILLSTLFVLVMGVLAAYLFG